MKHESQNLIGMTFTTHRSSILTSIGVWTLLFAAPAVSRADIVFTNFGAGFSYNTGLGNPVGNAFDGNNYAQGDTFTPTTSADLSSLDIALSCAFAGGCPDAFTVSLTGDSGNQPAAAPLESFAVLGTSLGLEGVNNPPVVLNSVLQPSLKAGTQYWVTVSADLNDSIAWNLNSTGDTSAEALSTDGGATWFSPSGLTPGAYQVNGAAPVPEPGARVLLGAVLLLLALGNRGALLRDRRADVTTKGSIQR